MNTVYEQATVKMFSADRKFGFLKTKDGDVFFHATNEKMVMELEGFLVFINGSRVVRGEPKPGDKILFERARGDRGQYAKNWGFAPISTTTGSQKPAQTIAQMREVIRAAEPGDKLRLMFTNKTFAGDLRGRIYIILATHQNGSIHFEGGSALILGAVGMSGRWDDFHDHTITIQEEFDADYFISKTIGKEMLVSVERVP